jgi:chromosome segregation ATPase
MPRKAVATAESVAQAVESLLAEGLDPTVERVRSKIGGGSFTTINKVLAEVQLRRQTQAIQISEVPSDLVEIGQRAVAAIYAAVQRQAAAKIELIEADARQRIDATNRARAEAALEIERLEGDVEQGTEALATAQQSIQDSLARAERAEATAKAAQSEIERLTRAFAGAQADAQSARESDQESQRRSMRAEDARRTSEAESRKENDRLQKALAHAEAQIKSLKTEILSATKETERARESERRARDEASEMRGKIKALQKRE